MRRCLHCVFVFILLSAARISTPLQVRAQQASLLDINTATPQQLKALPGMGEAYARRVIQGRPYTAKNQLVTRGILPASAYEQIKDRIVAHRLHPFANGSIAPQNEKEMSPPKTLAFLWKSCPQTLTVLPCEGVVSVSQQIES